MPRVYNRKRPPRYTLEDLKKAVKDVEDKKKTYRQAEEEYNVPVSVIYHRIKGRKVSIERMGAGASRVLPQKIEGHIVSCLKTRAEMGYPCQKEELKNLVKEYIESNNLVTPFKNNKPGDDWYLNFMKRYPNLTLKKAEHLQKARQSSRKPHIVYHFYDTLKKVVFESKLEGKPEYIYNCDESGFQCDPGKLKGIGIKGKPLSRVSGGSGRDSTTVLACVSADGKVLPPLIVFKGAAVQARWTSENSYPGTFYAATKNGWMEEPVFFNWFVKSFIAHINTLREERNEPDQKALLLYDGHSSHISIRIIEEAEKANIVLLRFPSHMTDRIQPLDKCVFGPVKKAWEKKLIEHGVKQMGKGSGRLTRDQFSELLGEVYNIAFKPNNIIAGFTTTGLYPVDPSKFPLHLFDSEDLNMYNSIINDILCLNDCNEHTDYISELPLDQRLLETDHTSRHELERPILPNRTEITNRSIHIPKNTDVTQMDIVQTIEDQEDTLVTETGANNKTTAEFTAATTCTLILPSTSIHIPKNIDTTDMQLDIVQTIKDQEETQVTEMGVNNESTAEFTPEITCTLILPSTSIQIPKNIDTTDMQLDIVQTIEDPEETQVTEKSVSNKTTAEFTGSTRCIPILPSTSGSKSALVNNSTVSPLINQILKLISTDNVTSDRIKRKIISSFIHSVTTDEEIKSPSKQELENIFGISKPVKKTVIPRLKQSAFGEVLTSKDVKERLKKAEDERSKKTTTKNKLKTHEKKGKGTGKKSIDVSTKLKEKKLKRVARERESISSEDDVTIEIEYAESDYSEYNVRDEYLNEIEEFEKTKEGNPERGNFILVSFKGGKRLSTTYKYVCVVDAVDTDEGEVRVTSLKCADSSKTLFTLNDNDKSDVPYEDIIGIINEPHILMKGERIYYKFEKAVDVFERA